MGVEVTPDGSKVYVANSNVGNVSDTVSVIDTKTNTVTVTVPVGTYPFRVAITPDGTRVCVTDIGNNTVSVINTTTNTVTATVNVGQWLYGVAVTPDGTKAYVANSYDNTVSVIHDHRECYSHCACRNES